MNKTKPTACKWGGQGPPRAVEAMMITVYK